nr:hypothetical protein [Polymorphobacter sp.]
MRLTDHEVAAIKAAAREAFGETAVVRLFGSRVDDTIEGGDVDLHVEANPLPDMPRKRFDFVMALYRRLHHDKIDVIVSQRGGTPRGFERIAYRDGIIL